jgi:SAM-dependent methyltransferase
MSTNSEDKRNYQRVKTSLKVEISGGVFGESADVSEGGLSFSVADLISSPNISLKVRFPKSDFELESKAKLIWQRNLESGNSLYGVEFIDLNESQKLLFRKELIKMQINSFLDEIDSLQIKKQIYDFFLEDVLHYINQIISCVSLHNRHKEYSLELQRDFDRFTTEILLKGYCLEELLSDKKIMQRVKDRFRQLVGTWIYKSIIVKRGFEKPRGYPGDYKMLETVYDNKPLSKDFGLYSDNCFLKSPYAAAVRIRKDRLREILTDFINTNASREINILDIACGSCREIKELLTEIKAKGIVNFSCLDWDEQALQFSQNVLLPNAPKNIQFKFIKQDVMELIKDEKIANALGKHNLIYSIGLIDYLPDRVLKKLIAALYQLLEKGGQLILTHKNSEKTFPPLPPDWFCDWKFVPRNKEETVNLFYTCGIDGFSLSIESDDFAYIYYFTLAKT